MRRTPHYRRFVLLLAGCILLLAGILAQLNIARAAASPLKVQYYPGGGGSSASTQQLTPYVQLVNTGSSSVTLKGLSLRYWFTRDSAQAVSVTCDWAVIGCGSLSEKAAALSSPTTGTDYYLEVDFNSGTLA